MGGAPLAPFRGGRPPLEGARRHTNRDVWWDVRKDVRRDVRRDGMSTYDVHRRLKSAGVGTQAPNKRVQGGRERAVHPLDLKYFSRQFQ